MKELSLVNDSLLRQRLNELGSTASWAPHVLSGLERFIRTAGGSGNAASRFQSCVD
jgi:hypothetical protein